MRGGRTVSVRHKRSDNENDAGFTLIEVLVAMMVLAIALVLILQLFSGGLNAKARSEDYSRAVFHAEQKLETILANPLAGEGTQSGTFEDGYAWTATIQERMTQDADDGSPLVQGKAKLYQIDLVITWTVNERPKNFQLSTLAIGAASAGNSSG